MITYRRTAFIAMIAALLPTVSVGAADKRKAAGSRRGSEACLALHLDDANDLH